MSRLTEPQPFYDTDGEVFVKEDIKNGQKN